MKQSFMRSIVCSALALIQTQTITSYPCVEVIAAVSALEHKPTPLAYTLYQEVRQSLARGPHNLELFSYTPSSDPHLKHFEDLYTSIMEKLFTTSSHRLDMLTDGLLQVAQELDIIDKTPASF